MIQRIQSVFLTFVLVGIVLMFMFPIAKYTLEVAGATTQTELRFFDLSSTITNENLLTISQNNFINVIYLPITAAVLGLLTLITIFLYKNRMLQVRLIAFAALINIAYIALIFFLAIDGYDKALEKGFNTVVNVKYSIGTFIPLVTLVLLVLAQRAIKSDERKVRSADRLR